MKSFALSVFALALTLCGAEAAVLTVEHGAVRVSAGEAFRPVRGSVDVRNGDVIRVEQGAGAQLEYAEGCRISLPEGDTTITDALCADREQRAFRKRADQLGADPSLLSTLTPPYAAEAYTTMEDASSSVFGAIADSYHEVRSKLGNDK